MRVLLTNDDGIAAEGICAMHDALTTIADKVMVVAPLTVQSATGHGVTYADPLMVYERLVTTPGGSFDGLAVDGRPADCTKLALTELWPERFGPGSRPDLVVSGMNMGANVGINVLYSGTVAAATEAAFLGVPAVAVSLHLSRARPDYGLAARYARDVIARILGSVGGTLRPHTCLNLNVPRYELGNKAHAEPPPLAVCPMNIHPLVDAFERRESPAGVRYYWASGKGLTFRASDEGSDVERLFARCCTLTPLEYDLTARGPALTAWSDRLS